MWQSFRKTTKYAIKWRKFYLTFLCKKMRHISETADEKQLFLYFVTKNGTFFSLFAVVSKNITSYKKLLALYVFEITIMVIEMWTPCTLFYLLLSVYVYRCFCSFTLELID